MGIYKPLTNFRLKDSLAPGNPQKLIVGAELQREFEAINASVDSMVGGYNGPLVNYAAKDLLTTGNSSKKVLGAEIDTELAAVDTAMTSVTGWSYTPTTTFASEATVKGDLLQDEFDALGLLLKSRWEAGATGSTAPEGPFWSNPVIGFSITAGAMTANGSPITDRGYANVDATGFGFYNYLGGTLVSDTLGSGLTTKLFSFGGTFMVMILEGASAPGATPFTSFKYTDSLAIERTITFASAFNTTVSGNMRRWAWDLSGLVPATPIFTVGQSVAITAIP